MILEELVYSQFDHITRLPAQEKLTEFSSGEQLKLYTRKCFVILHSSLLVFVVGVVCCQVEVCARSRSLVQRSPTEFVCVGVCV